MTNYDDFLSSNCDFVSFNEMYDANDECMMYKI